MVKLSEEQQDIIELANRDIIVDALLAEHDAWVLRCLHNNDAVSRAKHEKTHELADILVRAYRATLDNKQGELMSNCIDGLEHNFQNGACTMCFSVDPAKILGHHEQPLPTVNNSIGIQTLVIRDIEARREVGILRYGTELQANNGRDALRDAYEEALDLCCYLRQVIEERDNGVNNPVGGA